MSADTRPAQPAMTDEEAAAAARDIIADFATSYRDHNPAPAYGSTPPVAQPGRPPMSQRATDTSVILLAGGAASIPVGGMTSLVLYTLGHVDPTALAIGAAAPVALILAVSSLLRRAKGVLPGEHHHHYNGPVHQDQRHVDVKNTGISVKNTNKQ
ncbi:hypothetical protein ACL02U_12005 [Streptomyces sp. MS06]|uniref:hypothetical protein n=1 Tax=Streptomyces sp. MS06 TaxID=3385974 RepID=UPI00399F6A32